MPEFPRAVGGGLAVHSAVRGNDTPGAESVNVAKVRPGRHLRYWELQDSTRSRRIPLELSGLLQDNQGVTGPSSDASRGRENFWGNFRVLPGWTRDAMQPIDLGGGVVAATPEALASVILAASDKQVAEKTIDDPEGRADFLISTDALNYWRMAWRCSAEWGTAGLEEAVAEGMRAAICSVRGYDPDDFDSAIQGTRGRARLPFGWTALDLAWKLAQKEPIRLIDPLLDGKKVPTAIAGIAHRLQVLQGNEPILLPIDQLRGMLQQRKIVVSGAVQRLVEAKLLDYADKSYHTGKAREFRFVGVEGEHFEKAGPPS